MRNVNKNQRRNADFIAQMRAAGLAYLALCSLGAAHADELLLLQPGDEDAREYRAVEEGLRGELASSMDEPRIYSERVDSQFEQPRDRALFADYLRAKYRDAGIDAVVAVSDEAVRFVGEHRDAFGSIPLVYAARPVPAARAIPRSSLVVVPFHPARTLELALGLQPNLANVFVVAGPSLLQSADSAALHSALDVYSGRLNIEYLEGLAADELLERVTRLPPGSAVLYASLDADGVPGRQMAQRLSDRANAPVYGMYDGYIGLGLVGGFMIPSEQLGTELAAQTLRMLRGEYSEVAEIAGASFVVDARALRRWNLEETRLPIDAKIEFAPGSIWTRYQGWIIALLALVGVQFALIVTLLVQSISRRRDRLALAETAHRFLLARIAGKVGIWQWDLDKDELIVEPELRELLGFSAADPAPADGAALIHEEDLPKLRAAARAHAQGLTPSFDVQYRMKDNNGDTRWLLARGQVTAAGKRLIGTAIDITERKRDEDEKAQTLAQLQQQRIELAHLGRAAMAGALSGAVAHELNQPLSAMMSNARAALQFMAKGPVDAQEIKDILADIESDGRRAGEVIRHLRSLLRRGEGQLETINLDSIVQMALKLIHSDVVNLNIKVLHEPAAAVPPVLADSVQLQQVLLNLLTNACDALKGVDPRDRRISIAVTAGKPGRVRLSVADNGCGFGGGNPEHLFKPFVTTKRSGLGLGLSISRSILDAHGGRIWAETNRDAGATFHVELAVAAAERVA